MIEYAFQGAHMYIYAKQYLQHTFLLDNNGVIYPCDAAGNDFLNAVNLESIRTHIQCIKLSDALSNTTIILNSTSYNLRVIPMEFSKVSQGDTIVQGIQVEHIVILQNQAIYSNLINSLNRSDIYKNNFDAILDSYADGIFITASDGTATYFNSAYENLTDLKREQVLGRNIIDLKTAGYFSPIITPTILKTKQIVTVLQRFKTNKYAIITGTPIFDSTGEPVMILCCASAFSFPMMTPASHFSPDPTASVSLHLYDENSIDIIAESISMRHALQDAFRIASFDVPVLILGDSGTGKEVVATLIHSSSKRKNHPFLKINCSNLSATLLESELFGYEAGSFTGASQKGKPGLFEIAESGTILLDEIGEIPSELQAKLLRVLQSGEIYRVGGTKPIKINARLIASTNRNLRKMISDGTFRKDLYYRLNVATIILPSLSERKEDIAPMLLHYLHVFNNKYGMNKNLSSDLIETLSDYSWPGNVRELKNIVERLVIMVIEDQVTARHLLSKYFSLEREADECTVSGAAIPKLSEAVEALEKSIVKRALSHTGNTRKAAELIGVSQSTIMRKIKEYDITSDMYKM